MRSAPWGSPHEQSEQVLENTNLASWVSVGVKRCVLPPSRWLHDFQQFQRIQIYHFRVGWIFGYLRVSLQDLVHSGEKTKAREHIWANASGSPLLYLGHGQKALCEEGIKVCKSIKLWSKLKFIILMKVNNFLLILEQLHFFWSLFLESLLLPWLPTTSIQ